MLNILLLYKSYNNINDIYNYIKHIDNINTNVNLNILITIINTNKREILNKKLLTNTYEINTNVEILIYNYSCIYNDSLYNEIIKLSPYEILLFSDFNIYLSEPLLEYILLNKIDANSFIRTSILELENISDLFYENYNNNIFNEISNNIKYINDENLKQVLTKDIYIENFNNSNNNNIIKISNSIIIKNDIYYLNNANEFLLINKNLLLQYGLNISNKNVIFTNQYIILNLIKNNINMIKLPLILAIYKKIDNNILDSESILETNIEFTCNNTYDENIDYKLYNIKLNNEKSFIRSHIKILNGINNNDLKKTIKELNQKNEELNQKNEELNQKNEELNQKNEELNNNKSKNILIEKNKNRETDYNLFKNEYINNLKIINSDINEIIINSIKNINK